MSKTVGEIFKVLGGGTPSTTNRAFWNGKIPWATSADIGDDFEIRPRKTISREAVKSSATNLVPAGSIIVVTRVGLGKVGITKTDLCFSQDCQGLIIDNAVCDTRFVAHQLKLRVQTFKHISRGTTIAGVTKKQLLDVPFDLPSLDEQRRIVNAIEKQFTRLETGIDSFERVKTNLKRYRVTVLKAAFEGHLVSNEANIASKEKYLYETGPQLLDRILTERRGKWSGNRKYKEPPVLTDNLMALPEGWTWCMSDSLFSFVTSGSRGWAKYYSEKGDKFLGIGNLDHENLQLDLKRVRYVKPPKGAEGVRTIVQTNDILVSITADVGMVALVPEGLGKSYISQHVALVRPISSVFPAYIAYYLCASEGGWARLKKLQRGATKVGLGLDDIRSIPIPLPPLAEQKRIVAEIDRRLSVMEEIDGVITTNLQRANSLRQSILLRAFTKKQTEQIVSVSKTLKVPRTNRHFARALLSAEIVHQLHNEPTFGRVKHQKIFHLCEHIAQLEEIQGQYHREAAGPLDNKLIYTNESELKKQNWYKVVPREKYGHAYQPMAKCGEHTKYLGKRWANKQAVISRLIELMKKWDTERCEIFSTAYAAWNDLIIWRKEVTDEAILHEVLNRWNDSKRRISKERWLKAIEWMRREKFVPTGFGKPTAQPC